MSDELLLIVIALIDLSVMVVMWRMGRRWLELFIVLNYVVTNLTVQKFTPAFGLEVPVAVIFFSAIFLGTDIITEHYGKKAGFQMIWKAFFAILFIMLAEQAILLLSATESTEAASEAMDTLFSSIPRITAASLITFLIVQRFDIWFYHWIHEKTRGSMLWLRNLASTCVSQTFDNFLFFTLAFYAILPNNVILSLILTTLIAKFAMALLDTPFIYLSYWIKGKKLSDAKVVPQGS